MSLAAAKWQSSGLTNAHAKTLRLRELSERETRALSGTFAPVRALHIPYFDFNGKPTKFFRVRYLETPPGFAGVLEKPQRYAQMPDTLNEIYAPPLRDWRSIINDPRQSIYITEGELKAACACVHGLPTLGLGGVYTWRSARRELALLPQLKLIDWRGRSVFVIFDSDSATNENVVRASLKLCEALTAEGATPVIVSLPTLPKMTKTGLDDFLISKGPEALQELIDDADSFGEATELWGLSAEVAYIRDPGFIVVRGDGRQMTPGAFKEHAYANRHYYEQRVVDEQARLIKKPLAPRWLEWEQRFELARCVYEPGQPRITEKHEWNGWSGWGCEPKKGDVTPWKELLDFMFKGNDKARTWFERWCAAPLQKPGLKQFSSVAVWGTRQGTGKTLIGYSLIEIYGKNGIEIKQRHLESAFNEWAQNKQFILGDEVTGNDSRQHADMLKGMITQEKLSINAKYMPSYEIRDCLNYYFTSQHPDAFFLDDTDRRFFIHEAPHAPLGREFYRTYEKWLRGSGPSHLFHHLLNLNMGDFDPKAHALETSAKRAMIVDNKSELGMFCMRLKEDPDGVLSVVFPRAKGAALVTSEQLLQCYDPERSSRVTVNGLGRELKRSGFRQVNEGGPVRTSNGLLRLFIIRDDKEWLKTEPDECADHWNEKFGAKIAKFKGKSK